MRTTLDIDDPILKEIKSLQENDKRSLGRLVSDLLARALREARTASTGQAPRPRWITKPMRARIDLEDKETVYALMEKESGETKS